MSATNIRGEMQSPHSSKISSSKASFAYRMKRFKSDLEIAPIGLTSALEQSYLVKYPRRLIRRQHAWRSRSQPQAHLSSTLALPKTSKPPVRPRAQGRSCAKR